MKIMEGQMIALGYGKYFRSDSIVGVEPVEEGRGPGKRTLVFIENFKAPVIASRSEAAILRDLIDRPREITRSQQQHLLLGDILDTLQGINPVLRAIIRDQAHWDLDRTEERIREILGDEEAQSANQPSLLPF